MALTDKSSIVVPKGFYGKANVLQGFNPQTENLVDLDVVRNTTATRVNEQGLITEDAESFWWSRSGLICLIIVRSLIVRFGLNQMQQLRQTL